MSGFYLDGDTEREIREAMRLGATLEFLAGKLQCSPEQLASLLNMP